jgi:hypothetical protein
VDKKDESDTMKKNGPKSKQGYNTHIRSAFIQLFWVSVVVMAGFLLSAQMTIADTETETDLEYRVKAAFLLNFCQFVFWPDRLPGEKTDEPLFLCVIGENPFKSNLETIAGKRVRGRPLVVKFASSVDTIGLCHLLFVGKSNPKELAAILEKVKTKPILTVGEMEDFARQGGMISFVEIDNKIRFEVNPKSAESAGLKISSQLLKLAIISEKNRVEGN